MRHKSSTNKVYILVLFLLSQPNKGARQGSEPGTRKKTFVTQTCNNTWNQGVTNNTVSKYYSNSQTEQYLYSVFGLSQYRIVFSIWCSVFLAPQIVFGYSNTGQNICPNSSNFFLNNMSSMTNVLILLAFFAKFCILFGIQYFVFVYLDQIVLFIFIIPIFSIPNSIQYSVFVFSRY